MLFSKFFRGDVFLIQTQSSFRKAQKIEVRCFN